MTIPRVVDRVSHLSTKKSFVGNKNIKKKRYQELVQFNKLFDTEQ